MFAPGVEAAGASQHRPRILVWVGLGPLGRGLSTSRFCHPLEAVHWGWPHGKLHSCKLGSQLDNFPAVGLVFCFLLFLGTRLTI